jgi:2-phosphosulfolactate phosphatase
MGVIVKAEGGRRKAEEIVDGRLLIDVLQSTINIQQSAILYFPMKPTLSVYALPRLVEPEDLAGGAAVVIDVLRAATTIAYALDAGAVEIIPCLEVADALALAERFPADRVVLGGERDGLPIDGFQLGNSPEQYCPARVAGKTIIFTTTNGTRAMAHAQAAREVLVAAFVNVSAVVARLLRWEKISILCAGTDGHHSEDDVLLAGLLVDRLQRQGGVVYQQNGQAIAARELWLDSFPLPQALGVKPPEPDRLADRLRKSLGAQSLIALGLDDDILAAAQIDRFQVVPRLDTKTFQIRRAEG